MDALTLPRFSSLVQRRPANHDPSPRRLNLYKATPADGETRVTNGQTLRRELGLTDAVLLGLGSIVGTGVYVSLGFVIGLAGSMTIPVIITAGLIALCNGLSSAQLAAVHPVAGGTYEYGYKFLGPRRGQLAGWMFLIAKTASAATAALGLGAAFSFAQNQVIALELDVDGSNTITIVQLGGVTLGSWTSIPGAESNGFLLPTLIAVCSVVLLGILTHAGLRRASWANSILVVVGIVPLLAFVAFVGVIPKTLGGEFFNGSTPSGLSIGTAVALAFVAFTGYGRVATLAEEVKNPRRTIPIAMVVTLTCCLSSYAAVAWTCFAVSSDISQPETSRPLLAAVELWDGGKGPLLKTLTIGGIAAMVGVILNLILGLSRVVLAMARRGDLPGIFARIQDEGRSPGWAVLLVTVSIAGVAAFGGIKTSWTVSAITVLIYYSLTNWAALKVTPEDRFIPSWVSSAGLAGCLFFAPFAVIELLRG